MTSANDAAYHEVCCYTLTHGDPSFIHQHVVDAFTAQIADEHDKPIGLTFALVGLYLHVEQGFTGKQVQLAHMKLARRKRPWPLFEIPQTRGEIVAVSVLEATAGSERDQMIHDWCVSVWEAFASNRDEVDNLLRDSKVL